MQGVRHISMLGYYMLYNKDGEVEKGKSFVVLSDDLTHKTESVYASYMKIDDWIKQNIPERKHITFVSDGSAAQFKNKGSLQRKIGAHFLQAIRG